MNFRYDINGIRAIAILSVLIFHFSPQLLTGGFIGVDIFFVISGFLMAGIILTKINNESFNLLNFYKNRAVRIVPPLAILCLLLITIGWFTLNPIDYKSLGKHIEYAITFLSNIKYQRESGYFDSTSSEKWLLHTWSLSIEWQFYIVFPIIIILIKKIFGISKIKLIITILFILSLLTSSFYTEFFPSKSYYSIISRSWELMAGAIIFLYLINVSKKSKIFEFLGSALIMSSIFYISPDIPWPGYITLIPIIGTGMIIVANNQNSIITNNVVFQKIGNWSYSIYIFHWPIVVLFKYIGINKENYFASIIGIITSIMLGFVSYKTIENKKLYPKRFIFFIVFIVIFIYMSGLLIFKNNGFIERFNSTNQKSTISAFQAISNWKYPKPNLFIDGLSIRFIPSLINSDKNILFIGASHIEQTYPYVLKNNIKYNVYYLTSEGCFVTPSMKNPQSSCDNIQKFQKLFNKITFEKVVTSFYCFDCFIATSNKLVLDKNVQVRINEYNSFLNFLKEKTKKIYMILGEPQGEEFDPIKSIRYSLPSFISIEKAKEKYYLHEKAIKKIHTDGINIIDPFNYMCDKICKTKIDGEFIYKDSNHMRSSYAEKALVYLDKILE